MAAISSGLARPQPLASHTLFPTRRKYQLVRMKEMLSNALNGNRSGGLFSVSAEPPAGSAYPRSAFNEGFAMPSAITPSSAVAGFDVTTDAQRRGSIQAGSKAASRMPADTYSVDKQPCQRSRDGNRLSSKGRDSGCLKQSQRHSATAPDREARTRRCAVTGLHRTILSGRASSQRRRMDRQAVGNTLSPVPEHGPCIRTRVSHLAGLPRWSYQRT